ncbi:MAG: carbohydrate ABC transporter permease [Thermotogae bacterium]|nr:carbohydrate ABC transporter permease [Thermotogota bacterium]
MRKKHVSIAILYVLAAIAVVVINVPLVFIILTSFKPLAEIMQPTLKFSFMPTLENYRMLFSETFYFGRYISNSVLVALLSTVIAIAVSLPAAYGISRFGEMKKGVAFWILSIRMVPPVVFALPLFLLLRLIGLIDNIWGLTTVYLTSTVPLSVWILTTFMSEIPQSVEEAAMLDGASRGRILLSVMLPLMGPGLVSVFILNFIFAWNEFFFALLMTQDRAVTFTVGMARFITGYSIYWGAIAAAATISIAPMLIMTVFIQRYLVRGLTFGAVK